MDFSGPISVFSTANELRDEQVYHVELVSVNGGKIGTDSGVEVLSKSIDSVHQFNIDTIIVSGGGRNAINMQLADKLLLDWLRGKENKVRRMASVCSGAFILAKAGLLQGKSAATHWSACHTLAKHYPKVKVDENALYVTDGKLWTSAGVTTGIDMCLAMLEQDLSSGLANEVAQQLVLYARRPGHQSQFSPVLNAQSRAGEPFSDLLEWMQENIHLGLDVRLLADRCNMSERTFYRHFTASTGMTPANLLLRLRLDRVRVLLSSNEHTKRIVKLTGFSSVTHMSSAFLRHFGISIAVYKTLHNSR